MFMYTINLYNCVYMRSKLSTWICQRGTSDRLLRLWVMLTRIQPSGGWYLVLGSTHHKRGICTIYLFMVDLTKVDGGHKPTFDWGVPSCRFGPLIFCCKAWLRSELLPLMHPNIGAQNGNFGYNILYAVIIIYIIHTYKMVVIMSIYNTYIYIYILNDYRLFYTYSIYSLWGTPHKSYYAWLHINYGLPYLHRLLKPKQLLPPCLPHPLNQVLDPDLESWPAPKVSFQRNILWAETSDNYHRTFTTWLWQCIYLESFWLLAFHVGTKEDNQLTGCDRHLKPADHLIYNCPYLMLL